MTEQWAVVEEVAGSFQADIIKGLLVAQGIPVIISKPGAGTAIGITVGSLGRVQLLVPANELEHAKQVVSDYYAGEYEDQQLVDPQDGDSQSESALDEE